ncbi:MULTISPECIES: hypothetical protein [unclassified Microcoleus]|nr:MULTISPECIES: hypothetical protein [unclassified Microcoleus]
MKSSTRAPSGFCLCSSGFQPPGFLGFSHFWIDGRSHLREMCDRI